MADDNSSKAFAQQDLFGGTPKKKRTFVSAADKAKMVSLVQAGETIEGAAKAVGRTAPSCVKALAEVGLYQKTVQAPTREQLDQMVELYLAGMGCREAAAKFGFCRSVCNDELHRREIALRTGGCNIWPEERAEELRRRFPAEGYRPLAEEWGLSKQSIQAKALQLGLRSANHFKHVSKALSARNTSCDWRYFDTWSPNMAWALGYIWADGCITPNGSLQLGCVTDDEEVILAIRDQLKSDHLVRRYPERTNNQGYLCRPMTRVTICSRLLVDSLERLHGLRPNKSNLDLPFPEVPADHLCHFARGNLDGDGSIFRADRKTRVSFLGSRRFMVGLQNAICAQAGLRSLKMGRCASRKIVHFGWSHHDDVKKLAVWLYPPGEYLSLRRKREALAEGASVEVRRKRNLDIYTSEQLLRLHADLGNWSAVCLHLDIPSGSMTHLRRKLGLPVRD